MSTPSQELAERIFVRLTAEKLVVADDAKKLAPKMVEGKLRSEDWKLAIEKALEKVAKA